MARSISAIDEEGGKGKWEEKKEKKADKLIEAEKSETGKVGDRISCLKQSLLQYMSKEK